MMNLSSEDWKRNNRKRKEKKRKEKTKVCISFRESLCFCHQNIATFDQCQGVTRYCSGFLSFGF